MVYLIGFETALECYRSLDTIAGLDLCGLNAKGVKEFRIGLPDVPSLLDEVNSYCEFGPIGEGKPNGNFAFSVDTATKVMAVLRHRIHEGKRIDLVVPEGRFRSRSRFVRCHSWTFPVRCKWAIRITSDIFLVSPEGCYLQMGKSADRISLMKLGFELCGSYSLSTQGTGFRNRPPLCRRQDIARLGKKISSNNGVANALNALRFVRENSASPMETSLALLFGLTPTYGGFGLGMPEMNAPIRAPQETRGKTVYRLYHCDLYWPDYKVAVEYNSTQFHANESALTRDAIRMNDLSGFGIKVLVATRVQISNPVETEIFANQLAFIMGKRIRSTRADLHERRYRLRGALFGGSDCR